MIDISIIEECAKLAPSAPVYPDPRFPPSIYYRFLGLLAQYTKPKMSVELGVCGGGAGLYLARGNPEGMVYGFDVCNDYPDNIKHIQSVCSNYRFVILDSITASTLTEISHVDILFIDTVHTYEQTMLEYHAWYSKLLSQSIIILDDLYRDGMVQAFNDIPGNKRRFDTLHIGGAPTDGGFGVIML